MFEIAGDILGNRPAAYRFTGGMHGLAIPAHQIMPVGKRFIVRAEAIGAGTRQPGDLLDIAGGEPDAFGDIGAAMLVVAAEAGLTIEQATGNIGRIEIAGVLILDLVQAAFAAAVAQRFPLRAVEGRERLLPEGRYPIQRSISATIACGF